MRVSHFRSTISWPWSTADSSLTRGLFLWQCYSCRLRVLPKDWPLCSLIVRSLFRATFRMFLGLAVPFWLRPWWAGFCFRSLRWVWPFICQSWISWSSSHWIFTTAISAVRLAWSWTRTIAFSANRPLSSSSSAVRPCWAPLWHCWDF